MRREDREMLLTQILEARVKKATTQERVAEGHWSTSSTLIFSARRYVAWHIAFVLLQFMELAVLAMWHRVYFPPESLVLLRLTSSVALLATLVSIQRRFHFIEPSVEQHNTSKVARAEHTIWTARFLFQATVLLSLLLCSFLIFFTHLHLSSPALFRAVLVSGLVTLPFYSLLGFMFMNYAELPQLVPSTRTRGWLLASGLLGVVWIALNQPLLYLLTTILPPLGFAHFIWRRASGKSISWLYEVPRISSEWRQKIAHTFHGRLGHLLLLAVAMEASFYLSFWYVKAYYSLAPFALFLAHRLTHLGLIISLRTAGRYARTWWVSLALPRGSSYLPSMRFWPLLVVSASSLTLLFAPLLIWQRDYLVWASPTGELEEWNGILFAAIALLLLSRTWSFALCIIAAPLWRGVRATSHLLLLVCCDIALCLTTTYLSFSYFSDRAAFFTVVLVSALVHTLLGLRSYRALERWAHTSSAAKVSRSAEFINELWKDVQAQEETDFVLILLKYENPWSVPLKQRLQALLPNTESPHYVLPLRGRRALWLVATKNSKVLHRKLVATLGPNLARCQVLKRDKSDYERLFPVTSTEIRRAGFVAWLADLINQTARSAKEHVPLATLRKDSSTEEDLQSSVFITTRKEGWKFTSELDSILRARVREYAYSLFRRDRLYEPRTLWQGEWKGFAHRVDEKGLSELLWIPHEVRSIKSKIERRLIEENLHSLITTSDEAFRQTK